ncbi:hypothetical protein LQ938_13245 [Microbacterium sp. cx-55]|uniref:hypothetical protein n=1 Tax=Microbacterium sp. cx-55 TaxID=2875948 RepID=UPI001CBC3DFF|nr:hypothetical protein [Microbacterium sp. cx-55]MBZ4487769.1 hypothetical protein [Microbacterium sp. cx-55]UGB36732.1 hypothetical protein LQ938_13245 [Microbacterium sp. cx-55]
MFHHDGEGAGTTWARVEDGFHVGSRHGEFLGYIDRQADGRFVAFDLHSRIIGGFVDLTSAMRAVSSSSPSRTA